MALQFSATNFSPARGLIWWMARATSSLPVPVSPRIRMVLVVGATVSTILNTSCIAALRPTSCASR